MIYQHLHDLMLLQYLDKCGVCLLSKQEFIKATIFIEYFPMKFGAMFNVKVNNFVN